MKPQYENILVAYDGSELSNKSLQHAIFLLKENKNTKLHVIAVIHPTGPVTNAIIYENIKAELEKNATAALEEVKKQLITLPNQTHLEVLEGNPGKVLTSYAKENDIELIMMGSRGLGNVDEFILGSVSHSVLQQAVCSVLIMK